MAKRRLTTEGFASPMAAAAARQDRNEFCCSSRKMRPQIQGVAARVPLAAAAAAAAPDAGPPPPPKRVLITPARASREDDSSVLLATPRKSLINVLGDGQSTPKNTPLQVRTPLHSARRVSINTLGRPRRVLLPSDIDDECLGLSLCTTPARRVKVPERHTGLKEQRLPTPTGSRLKTPSRTFTTKRRSGVKDKRPPLTPTETPAAGSKARQLLWLSPIKRKLVLSDD